MKDLAAAISRAAAGGNPSDLLDVVRALPRRPDDGIDPQSGEDLGPIPGESFDDVTAAWIAGRLSDEVYDAAIEAAASS